MTRSEFNKEVRKNYAKMQKNIDGGIVYFGKKLIKKANDQSFEVHNDGSHDGDFDSRNLSQSIDSMYELYLDGETSLSVGKFVLLGTTKVWFELTYFYAIKINGRWKSGNQILIGYYDDEGIENEMHFS